MNRLKKTLAIALLSISTLASVTTATATTANAMSFSQYRQAEAAGKSAFNQHTSEYQTTSYVTAQSTSSSDFTAANHAVCYSDPIITDMIMNHGVTQTYYTSNGSLVDLGFHWNGLSKKQVKKLTRKYYKKVKACVRYAKKGKTKKEKIKRANNYITKHTSYKRGTNSLYSVLYKHKGNCLAYSGYFQMVMNKLHIQSRVVVSSDNSHAWNQVKVAGKWYHVDTTYNDSTNNQYLLINDKRLKN